MHAQWYPSILIRSFLITTMHKPPNKYIPDHTKEERHTAPLYAVLVAWFCGCMVALFFFPQLKAYIHTADDDTVSQDSIQQTSIPLSKPTLQPSIDKKPFVSPDTSKVSLSAQENTLPTTIPQRILLIGSSSMNSDLGAFLAQHLRKKGLEVHRHAKVGSGLARPDFYNWMDILPELIKTHTPDLVIAQFIGNDCQSLILPDGSLEAKYGTSEWNEAYQKRIYSLISTLHKQGIRIVFLGMSNVLSPKFRTKLRRSNTIIYQVADKNNTPFVSLWEITSTPNGAAQTALEIGNIPQRMYQEDGVHLSRPGARMVARDVFTQLEQIYGWNIP